MSCGCNETLTDEQRFGVPENTPCASISVDLLSVYKKPIDCYLKYSLWSQISVSKEELEAASAFLDGFIAQKISDHDNCTGIENLVNVRKIVSLIVQKGICL